MEKVKWDVSTINAIRPIRQDARVAGFMGQMGEEQNSIE